MLRCLFRQPEMLALKSNDWKSLRHAVARQRPSTAQRLYMLQSHVLSSSLYPGLHISQRVALEQSLASELGMGLFAPFHIKRLKRLTGVASFSQCPLELVALLLQHAEQLLHQRHVAFVIDDLDGLMQVDPDHAAYILDGLITQGFLVLVKSSTDLKMPQ